MQGSGSASVPKQWWNFSEVENYSVVCTDWVSVSFILVLFCTISIPVLCADHRIWETHKFCPFSYVRFKVTYLQVLIDHVSCKKKEDDMIL